MNTKWRIAVVALVGLSLAGAAVACGDDDEGTSNATTAASRAATTPAGEGAAEQVCTDLDALKSAVFDFQALNRTSTVDEVKSARDDIRQALDDVKSSAADVREARVDDIDTAFEGFNTAVDNIRGDQTLADVQADLQDAAVDVLTSVAAVGDRLNCPEETTPARTSTTPAGTSTP